MIDINRQASMVTVEEVNENNALSDGESETHDVAGGEQDGAENNEDATERDIWRRIE